VAWRSRHSSSQNYEQSLCSLVCNFVGESQETGNRPRLAKNPLPINPIFQV